jgi:hypothetical protein
LDGGIFPRAADADGFAEAPQIVHDPEPNRGLAIGGPHDVGIRMIRAHTTNEIGGAELARMIFFIRN